MTLVFLILAGLFFTNTCGVQSNHDYEIACWVFLGLAAAEHVVVGGE